MQSLIKDELLRLLAAARKASERDWLMILVAFNHGLRASELVGLTRENVRDGFLDVQRLKGSKRTVQPLLENADPLLDEREALLLLAKNQRPNQRLFPLSRRQFQRIMERHCATAGIPRHNAHPHILKHSIAKQTIKAVGVENTKQWLGHKSGASTLEYLKVSDDEAAAAMEQALKGV